MAKAPGRDDDRSDQCRLGAVNDAREDVAAEKVRPGPERGRGRRVADAEALGEGRVGGDQAAEDGRDHDDQNDEAGGRDHDRQTAAAANDSGGRDDEGQGHASTLPKRMRGSIIT